MCEELVAPGRGRGLPSNSRWREGLYKCRQFRKQVVILGHSYVHDLQPDRPEYEPGFAITSCAASGATATNLRYSPAWRRMREVDPDLTFLVIGGNDIGPDTVVRDVANNIKGLAQEIEEITGGFCVIIGIEYRLDNPRSGVTREVYGKIRNSINRYLSRNIRWTQNRFLALHTFEEDFRPDGVHLKPEASKKLMDRIVEEARKYFTTFYHFKHR